MGACFPFEAPHTEGLFKSSHRSFIVIFPLIRYLNFSLLGNYWFSLFTPCSLTYTLKLTASQLHHLCNSNNIWCRLNKQSVSDWKAQTTPADPDNTVTERDTRAICLLHMLSRAVARNSGPCALNCLLWGPLKIMFRGGWRFHDRKITFIGGGGCYSVPLLLSNLYTTGYLKQ